MDANHRTVAIDQPVDPDLAAAEAKLAAGEREVGPGSRGGEAPEAEAAPGGGFEAHIADAPIAVRLDQLFTARGVQLPEDFEVYRGTYDAWLVPHRVAIVRRRGLSELTAVGIRIAYQTKAGSVVSLLPEFQFIETASLTFRCSADIHGALQASQDISAPQVIGGGQLRVGVASQLGMRIGFELAVLTPIISAMGKGSRRAEWNFERSREPLHGRDIETWSILLVPAGTTTLEYEIVMSLTRRLAFFPTRWESAPLKVVCSLAEARDPRS